MKIVYSKELRDCVWPDDVGVSREDGGVCLRMLCAYVCIHNGEFHVVPHHPNIGYALGCSSFQVVARLGLYGGSDIHHPSVLRTYLLGQFISYDQVCRGQVDNNISHVLLLLYETLRLGWPHKLVTNVLLSTPRRHSSPFVRMLRKIGKLMRKWDLLCLFPLCSSAEWLSHDPIFALVVRCDNLRIRPSYISVYS